MPQHVGKVITKPPPPRDIKRRQPERFTSTSTPSTSTIVDSSVPQQVVKKEKSKAEKLFDIQLWKLRSLARPLDLTQKGEGERRFFEWGVDQLAKGVAKWEKEGKWDGKVERVWVFAVGPARQWVVQVDRLMVAGDTLWKGDGPHDSSFQDRSSSESQ